MQRFLTCLILTFILLINHYPSAAEDASLSAEMAEVCDKIDAQRVEVPIGLPGPGSREKPYYKELMFTIIALQTDSFVNLFDRNTRALIVFSNWLKNVEYESPSGCAKLLAAMRAVVTSLENYPDLSFASMVDLRLQDTLKNSHSSVNSALETLMSENFQFPLLRTYAPTTVERTDILKLLHLFCQKHIDPEASTGGFGNLTWYEIYYSPTDPEYFSQLKIRNTMQATFGKASMIGHIIPSPSVKFKTAFALEDYEDYVTANNLCCCNFYFVHPGHFRRCVVNPGLQCEMCTQGGYTGCCVGSNWCPTPGGHTYP